MASQAPTEIPSDSESAAQGKKYLTAWSAVESMLRDGHSWSGHEANCCFLNTHGKRFANASAISGLDFKDDSRAVAVVDWDNDGDLDLWVTNRTSPRVRFMQNQGEKSGHFISLKLEGTKCNRNAIGARVELYLRDRSPLTSSLRAGEGFLSQSSMNIHFGLGEETDIERIVIHWPGGEPEEFNGISADNRYELVQGSGIVRRIKRATQPIPLKLVRQNNNVRELQTKRIVTARRLPFPTLSYKSLSGESLAIDNSHSGPVLINLWAPWCKSCLVELKELADNRNRIRAARLKIIPINVDGANPTPAFDPGQSQNVLKNIKVSYETGLATRELLDRLDVTQRALTKKQAPLPIPSSFLLDNNGLLYSVYKGPVTADQLLHDLEALDVSLHDPRDAAVPFPGHWYTNPFPPDVLAIPERLIGIGQVTAARDYLVTNESLLTNSIQNANSSVKKSFANKVAAMYFQIAELLVPKGDLGAAAETLRLAIGHRPDFLDARFGLAAILIQQGNTSEAIDEYHEILRLKPGHPTASNNLSWILATSDDPSIRNAEEAVRLAEHVCKLTKYQAPSALDTLGTAYAEAGRFEDAAKVAKKAVELLAKAGKIGAASPIVHRLKLYEKGIPYRDLNASP